MLTPSDIETDVGRWTSIIAKYVVSRSSRFLSKETQDDGRSLIICCLINILLCIGVASFANPQDITAQGVKLKFNYSIAPIVFELVCIYYAIAFGTAARSDVKSWQFKSLIEGSDDYDPLHALMTTVKNLQERRRAVADAYLEASNKLSEKYKIEPLEEITPENLHRVAKKSEEDATRFAANVAEQAVLDASYNADIAKIDVENELFMQKAKMYKAMIPEVVDAYKKKYWISITFPYIMFGLSMMAVVYYLIGKR